MYKQNYESDTKHFADTLDSAVEALSSARGSINSSITPEIMASMSPLQKTMIQKAQGFSNIDLSNPDKLLRSQKELTDLMVAAKRETDEALIKKQKTE